MSFHAIYLDDHDLTGPSLASGETLRNFPEKRKRMNLKAIVETRSAKYELRLTDNPVPLTVDNTAGVHEAGLLKLFSEGWAAWDVLKAERPGFKKDHGLRANPVSVGHGLDGPADTEADPGTDYYIIPAQIAPRGVPTRPGNTVLGWVSHYGQDNYTPICPRTGITLSRDLGVVTRAVQDVLLHDGHMKAFAMTTLPGHHSSANSFGGYCYVNFAAVAAKMLKQKFPKVAVVDVDYHHGNGTMGIFWEDPNVFFASLHMSPDYDYPYTSGYDDERDPAGTTLNIPVAPGITWPEYKVQLEKVLEAVVGFGACACVVSLGLDTLRGDKEASDGAGMALNPSDFTDMGHMFTQLPMPVLYIQEGGYYLESVAEAMTYLFDLH